MAADRKSDLRPIVRAAAAALSERCGCKVRFYRWDRFTERGRRNALLRCWIEPAPGLPSSVVIKKVLARGPEDQDSERRLLADWSGAALLTKLDPAARLAPRFLAGDSAHAFIMLSDLGQDRGSLVQPLLGRDASTAAAALVTLARVMARMQALTAGRRDEHRAILRAIRPGAARIVESVSASAAAEWKVVRLIESIAGPARGLEKELDRIRTAMLKPRYVALLHRDPCPDNVLVTEDGLRLHDFEFAGFGHPLTDLACFRMLFPSCWCANALPERVVRRAERAYQRIIAPAIPAYADEQALARALTACCARLLFRTLSWHLADCLQQDRRWGIAGTRARLLSRLDAFAARAERTGQYPAYRVTARRLRTALQRRWPETGPLPFYPAFR